MPGISLSVQNAGLVLIATGFLLTLRAYFRKSRSVGTLPPGPRGLPIVGNSYDIPATRQWITYLDMSRKYDSDVISLRLLGENVVVLNSVQAIDDLLENKSAIYSDRPPFHMLKDLVGFSWLFATLPYGPEWKERRKALVRHFQPSQVLMHRPAELKAARTLLQRLLESPTKYEPHLRHMAGEVIMSTVYGIDIMPENDPYIDIGEKAMHAFASAAMSGSYLVDVFPLLKYTPSFFPGAKFMRQARDWKRAVTAMPEVPFEFVKRARAAGTANSSIASRALDELEGAPSLNSKEKETVLRDALGACYGGADTTVSALGTFILAMTMFPEIQKKAQAAVDAVIGPARDRLPDFSDDIPYVDAVVREILRWHPVVPLTTPHRVSVDDIYKGYHIPKGATIIGNSWSVLHDEKVFGPQTDQFVPERWLTKDGEINTTMRTPSVAFGYGRRICPGKDMAEWSIWICAASILATFDIMKALDEHGVPIEPSGEYTPGLISYPIPHKCNILPRSEAARTLIQAIGQSQSTPTCV